MKKLVILSLLLTTFGSQFALAQATPVLSCFQKVGDFPNETEYSVQVNQNEDGALTLNILSCSGILNWGCGNGMANYINETHDVTAEIGGDYVGEKVNLIRYHRFYVLESATLKQVVFRPEQCRN